MWISSVGTFRKWNESSTGIIPFGGSVLGGNGTVSEPSEKKTSSIFLKPAPLPALEKTELLLLAAGINISREREKTHPRRVCKPRGRQQSSGFS